MLQSVIIVGLIEFADNNPFSPTYEMSVSSLPKPIVQTIGVQEQVTIMTESSFSEYDNR